MDGAMFGLAVGGLFVALFVLYYALALVIRLLAEQNIFWTLVREGTAKAIMYNNRFMFCIMSFAGHTFKGDTKDPPEDMVEKWDVVPYRPGMRSRRYLPLLRNIRWIGLPPFTDAHRYRFSWTSLEEETADKSKKDDRFHYSDKIIDYILLQDDVYVTHIKEAECADNIPLNAVLLIGGRIVNPYRALFNVERWLEATSNRVNSKMRDFFGGRTYVQIRTLADTTAEGDSSPHILYDYFKEVVQYVEEHWGFHISFVRILEVNPGSELAAQFIKASTLVYVATQKADADVQEGRGLAARDKAHFTAVRDIEGGADMFKWQQIKESGLTTYVEGGGAIISVPPGGKRAPKTPETPPAPPAETTSAEPESTTETHADESSAEPKPTEHA